MGSTWALVERRPTHSSLRARIQGGAYLHSCAVSQSNIDQAKGTLGRDSIRLSGRNSMIYLSGTAVLVTADGLGGDEGSLLGLDLGHWLGSLVLGSSRIHLRSRVLGDAIDGAVAGHFGLKSVNKKSEKGKDQKP